ncbi:MAG: hypothetical protein AAGG69_13060 [Pseudomonadota bacterium]
MDSVLIFILVGVGIIVISLIAGRLFKRTVNRQMPGQRDGTGAGFGIGVAHGAKSKGWLDGGDGFGGGGGGDG